mmetsp:Transcript_53325/g.60394  ORF Transcript_53325/g.60394 Transcript_53325/m.60394 type:complete len:188 (-) Transcript_53325:3604-4167(-)
MADVFSHYSNPSIGFESNQIAPLASLWPRRQRHDCKGRRRRLPELLHEPPRLHRAHLQLRLREGGRIGVQHGTRRHHGHLGRCQHRGWLWAQTIGITVPDVYEACVFALQEAGLLRVSEDAQRGRHEGTRLPQGPRRVFIRGRRVQGQLASLNKTSAGSSRVGKKKRRPGRNRGDGHDTRTIRTTTR